MQQYGFICVWLGDKFSLQIGKKELKLCAQSMLYICRNHYQEEFKQCFYELSNTCTACTVCTKKEENRQIPLQQRFRKIYSESI